MKITEFDIYKNLLKEKSGLVLTEDKSYLLESRLNPVAKKWQFADLSALAMALNGVPDPKLVNDIVEAMTTNETSFFRDHHPFESFKNFVLPYMLKTRINQRGFKLWCAAASSGQEPYTLGMTIKEEGAKFAGWNIKMVATDISQEILDKASRGLYSQFEVQRGLPIQMLMKYFTQIEDKWQISQDIRNMIEYKYFNLLESMAGFGKLDVVFCRNVLIYFDDKDKRNILERIEKQLEPDGFLFLGGAETVIGITELFKPVPNMRGVYAKEGSIHLKKDTPGITQPLASGGTIS